MLSPLRPRYVMVEGLERFVNYEPLRRVHECDFGVLARGVRAPAAVPPHAGDFACLRIQRRAYVLGPEAHADHPRRDSLQNREALRERHDPGDARRPSARQQRIDRSILNEELHGLRYPGWKPATPLHTAKLGERGSTRSQWTRQKIRGRDGVLDCEIEADASDRGHGVGRVADEEDAGRGPPSQPIHFHREEPYVVPTLDLVGGVAMGEEGHAPPERGEALA